MSTIRIGLTNGVGPTFDRDSVDFQPLIVTLDGVVVTDPAKIETSLVAEGARPVSWSPAIALTGDVGFMVESFAPGVYIVWVRVTDNPITAVEIAGRIVVS